MLDKSDLVIVENYDQAMKESSEVMGIENKSKIVELKDYIINKEKYSAKKTIFKSMGIGLEDVAAGYVILKNMGLLH